jgi:hypothetical protein
VPDPGDAPRLRYFGGEDWDLIAALYVIEIGWTEPGEVAQAFDA